MTRTRRRTATVLLVAALLVAGTGVVVTGTTSPSVTTSASAGGAEQATTTSATTQEGNVSLENLTAPEQVRTGTDYEVSATIVNRNDEMASMQVSYHIEGNVIAVSDVQVPGNGTETVRFDVAGNDTEGFPTGTFTHGVYTDDDNVTANLTLTDPDDETTPADTTTVETTGADDETADERATEETTPEADGETVEETTPEETTPEPDTPEETTPEETVTEATEAVETTPEEAQAPSIDFENQASDGSTVTVQSVTVPEGGFVVVHDNGIVEGNVVDSILGESDYLEAGTHQNVTIELNQTLDQSQRLIVVAYRDSNDNQEFDLVTSNRTADGPYTKPDSREAVNGIAVIDVNEGTANATTES